MSENETGKQVEVEKSGSQYRTVISWDTKRKYSKEQKKKQRGEFIKLAREGHIINLSSIMGTHGM